MLKRNSNWIVVLALLFGATTAFADDLVLVQDGKPAATIVIPDAPIRPPFPRRTRLKSWSITCFRCPARSLMFTP